MEPSAYLNQGIQCKLIPETLRVCRRATHPIKSKERQKETLRQQCIPLYKAPLMTDSQIMDIIDLRV